MERGKDMGRGPNLVIAGAVVTAVLISGCESGRPFTEGRLLLPNLFQGHYVQNGANRPMTAAATQPVASNVNLKLKPDGTAEGTSMPMAVSSSLQLVSGDQGSLPTPMLAITVPSMKLLVPIQGSYSYGPAPAQSETINTGAQNGALPPPTMQQHSPPAAIPSPVPSVPNGSTSNSVSGESTATPPPPISYLPSVPSATTVRDNTPPSAPTTLVPPSPLWPMADSQCDRATAVDSNP